MTALALQAGPIASLSGPIVDFCVNVIDDIGLAGVALMMFLHSACLPVPSEAVMLFAGFTVSEGHQTMLGVVAAGMVGQMLGSWLVYAVGYYGRIELLEKNRLIHLGKDRLAATDRWFARHGDAAVFWGRMVPVLRPLISLPAGMAEMPFWRFSWLTALGSLPWIAGLALLGDAVGHNWDKWRDHLQYLDYAAIALIVAAIVYLLMRRRGRGRRKKADAEAGAAEKAEAEPAGAGGR
jgi:membrane protein DedA with SNARE-associated domain